MDSKVLLVNAIMLLYRESQLAGSTENSAELVKEVVNDIVVYERAMETENGRDTIVSLRNTVNWMIAQPPSYTFDKDNLLQRIRINIGGEDYLYNIIADGFEPDESEEITRKRCIEYRNEMLVDRNKKKIKAIISQASVNISFHEDRVNWKEVARDITNELEPYTSGIVNNEITGMVTEVDLDNEDAIEALIEEGQNAMSTTGIIKFPWQGLNLMCGDQGGMRRGNSVLIGALQHNFKSGMLLNITKGAALYNDPYMFDETKKPLIVFITLENEVVDNILIMYKNMMENEFGKEIDIRTADKGEATRYVKRRLQERGYRVKMLRFDPSSFTYRDLFDLLDGYIADGWEIHLLVIDYLNKMSKEGCAGNNEAGQIRDLFSKCRNYTSPKNILFVTAHQLSSDAKFLIRQGIDDFVKEVANKGYYDSCKGVDQEVDMEITQHLLKPGDGSTYIEFQRGKHRKSGTITPEKDLYCVYKFEEVGDIPDDINGKSMARKQVGGSAVSDPDGGTAPWWSN